MAILAVASLVLEENRYHSSQRPKMAQETRAAIQVKLLSSRPH